MISDNYKQLNQELHLSDSEYGTGGKKWAKIVREYLKPEYTVLDYGAGKQLLKAALGDCVTSYDPCIPEISQKPIPADIVVCTDVLEHVEPEYIDETIKELINLTKHVLIVAISHLPGDRLLPDGSNTHRTVHTHEWWMPKFSELNLSDVKYDGDKFWFIATR